MDAGADDYLVKPFSAHELMARVRAHVRLSRARAEAADQVRHVVYQPFRDEYGAIDAIAIVGVEVTPLVRARAAAESANADKMQFLAAMSHELRTPLNAIAGYADLLQLGIHGVVTEEQRQVIQRMQRSGQRLLALINDVLNFAKLERGRVDYDIEDVNLAAVIGDVATILEPAFGEAQLAFSAQVDSGVTVRADRCFKPAADRRGRARWHSLSGTV